MSSDGSQIAAAEAAPHVDRRIDGLLREVLSRGGSDLHCVAGNPPRVRIYGELQSLRDEPVTQDFVRETLTEIMTRRSLTRLEEKDGADFAYTIPGVSRWSQTPRFYNLSAMPKEQAAAKRGRPAHNAIVGIGPLKLADYLAQSSQVTRTSDNQLVRAEYDRWVGSFKDDFVNVLADNIGPLLPTERIYLYPGRGTVPIDYQVVVDVVRCDGRLGEAAWLEARWSVFQGPEKKLLKTKRSSLSEAVTGADYAALVAAQSRALAPNSVRRSPRRFMELLMPSGLVTRHPKSKDEQETKLNFRQNGSLEKDQSIRRKRKNEIDGLRFANIFMHVYDPHHGGLSHRKLRDAQRQAGLRGAAG